MAYPEYPENSRSCVQHTTDCYIARCASAQPHWNCVWDLKCYSFGFRILQSRPLIVWKCVYPASFQGKLWCDYCTCNSHSTDFFKKMSFWIIFNGCWCVEWLCVFFPPLSSFFFLFFKKRRTVILQLLLYLV